MFGDKQKIEKLEARIRRLEKTVEYHGLALSAVSGVWHYERSMPIYTAIRKLYKHLELRLVKGGGWSIEAAEQRVLSEEGDDE